jgi:TRAP-type C4-dicarboxylate transport system substrate-binding protein
MLRRGRLTAAIAVISPVVFLVSACGGSTDEQVSSTATPTPSPEETVTVDTCEGDPVAIDFATFLGENTPQSTTMKWWADEISARSNGRVTVTPHYAQSLLPGTEALQGVGDGRAEVGWIGNFYHPAELPLSSVAELPFTAASGAALSAALNDMYTNYAPFREEYNKNNVHVLFVPSLGVNVIGTNGKAVESLADLDGLSIRAAGNTAAALQAVGVNPVALPAPEVFEAAQRGVIDGYSTITIEVLPAFGLEEVTEFITEAGTGAYVVGVMGMNQDFYQGLDECLRVIIDEVSNEAQSRSVDDLITAQAGACEVLKAAGISVKPMDGAIIEEWKSLSPDFRAQWIETKTAEGLPAQEFFDQYSSLLDQYESQLNVADGVRTCS